ncbi:MAG: nucleotidyl transferase AbiEii/AbiGii toxin family protein [Gemmatimonadota bacterium]|nr:nucleotidyl transferase AbiEii/AbiGii toxin family protein [Gemmatimonadota bacterium]
MNAPDPAALFLPGLEAIGVEYMVTGGVGAILYGEPRLTNDIDLVVRLTGREAALLAKEFPADRFYVPPIETLREEAARERHGHFNLLDLDTMLRADVYLAGQDSLQAWGLECRRRMPLGACEGWVASPEYVILLKLIYFKQGHSSKHLRDIAWMVRVSEALIDRRLLEQKVRELGLDAQWATALATSLDA